MLLPDGQRPALGKHKSYVEAYTTSFKDGKNGIFFIGIHNGSRRMAELDSPCVLAQNDHVWSVAVVLTTGHSDWSEKETFLTSQPLHVIAVVLTGASR